MKMRLAVIALSGALCIGGCSNMSDTERRMATGAGIGGAAAGILSGEWGWAAGGAAVGAAAGYLYDQHKRSEEEAYSRGVRDGQNKR